MVAFSEFLAKLEADFVNELMKILLDVGVLCLDEGGPPVFLVVITDNEIQENLLILRNRLKLLHFHIVLILKVFSYNLLEFFINFNLELIIEFSHAQWAFLLVVKCLVDALHTKSMVAWQKAWLDHEVIADRTVDIKFSIFFMCSICLLFFAFL